MTADSERDQCCDEMASAVADDDLHLSYSPKFREWGIDYRDGISIGKIEYCPWCGRKLPKDLGDEWVARLEAMGVDPGDENAEIPEAFHTDRWWKEAGL